MAESVLIPPLYRLKLLDLSSNFIADFPSAMVKKLKSLDRLLFRKNSIQSLEKDSFQVAQSQKVYSFRNLWCTAIIQ
jgi:hypothetical protein